MKSFDWKIYSVRKSVGAWRREKEKSFGEKWNVGTPVSWKNSKFLLNIWGRVVKNIFFQDLNSLVDFWQHSLISFSLFVCRVLKKKSITLQNLSSDESPPAPIFNIENNPHSSSQLAHFFFSFSLFFSHNKPSLEKEKTEKRSKKKSRNGKIIEIAHSWIACLLVQVELRFIKRIHMIEKQTRKELERRKMITICELHGKNWRRTEEKKALPLWKSSCSSFAPFFAFQFSLLARHQQQKKKPFNDFQLHSLGILCWIIKVMLAAAFLFSSFFSFFILHPFQFLVALSPFFLRYIPSSSPTKREREKHERSE